MKPWQLYDIKTSEHKLIGIYEWWFMREDIFSFGHLELYRHTKLGAYIS